MRVLKFVFSFILFLGAGYVGLKMTFNSWGSVVYFYPQSSDKRIPAAIQKSYDFSNLTGVALNRAAKERLLLDAKVYLDSSQLGIELGHFVQKNSEGYKELACHAYSNVELVFEANNMASSGRRPMMIVSAPCKVSGDYNRIEAIWIPTDSLLKKSISEINEGTHYGDKPSTKIQFKNVFSRLPLEWSLSQLRLYNENSDSEMKINKTEVVSILRTPFSLSFLEKLN